MSSADAQGFISYKNNLQEYAQKNHKPIPQYVAQKEDVGYSATVSFDGVSYSCQQSQRDKKDAEQGAAFEALKALGYIDANEMFSPKVAPEKGKVKSLPISAMQSLKTSKLAVRHSVVKEASQSVSKI